MVVKKTPSPAFGFVVQYLESHPEAAFKEVDEAARQAGLKLYPIVYGRAKAHLKLVPTAPRGQGKVARRAGAMAARATDSVAPSVAAMGAGTAVAESDRFGAETVTRRRVGRPARDKTVKITAPVSPMQSLEAVITKMREGELERERYRKALEQISEILQSVL